VIINSLGIKINELFAADANLIEVDISQLASGVYYVKLVASDTTQTLKFIKN
jgi:hypothetical protein